MREGGNWGNPPAFCISGLKFYCREQSHFSHIPLPGLKCPFPCRKTWGSQGRCFKRLACKLHAICPPSISGHALLLVVWRLQQLISALSFIIPLHPCSASCSWGESRKREKKHHTCIPHDQKYLIWSHSWGCYGDGQFWPSGCKEPLCCSHWVTKLRTNGCRESSRGPPSLRKWLATCSTCTPHSPKAFWWEVGHSKLGWNTLALLHNPQHALGRARWGGVLFHYTLMGHTRALWRSEQFTLRALSSADSEWSPISSLMDSWGTVFPTVPPKPEASEPASLQDWLSAIWGVPIMHFRWMQFKV